LNGEAKIESYKGRNSVGFLIPLGGMITPLPDEEEAAELAHCMAQRGFYCTPGEDVSLLAVFHNFTHQAGRN
jgi:hypothetical protein